MPNEMMRPCTLPASWKQPNGRPIEPFDAMEYLYYKLNFSSNSIGTYGILLFKSTGVLRRATFCCGEGKGDYYDYVLPAAKIECHLLSLAIAEALNAPVLATEEVLKDLPEKGEFWTEETGCGGRIHKLWKILFRHGEPTEWGYWAFELDDDEQGLVKVMPDIIYISPRNQIAQDYLLQFTLDEKRKETE